LFTLRLCGSVQLVIFSSAPPTWWKQANMRCAWLRPQSKQEKRAPIPRENNCAFARLTASEGSRSTDAHLETSRTGNNPRAAKRPQRNRTAMLPCHYLSSATTPKGRGVSRALTRQTGITCACTSAVEKRRAEAFLGPLPRSAAPLTIERSPSRKVCRGCESQSTFHDQSLPKRRAAPPNRGRLILAAGPNPDRPRRPVPHARCRQKFVAPKQRAGVAPATTTWGWRAMLLEAATAVEVGSPPRCHRFKCPPHRRIVSSAARRFRCDPKAPAFDNCIHRGSHGGALAGLDPPGRRRPLAVSSSGVAAAPQSKRITPIKQPTWVRRGWSGRQSLKRNRLY